MSANISIRKRCAECGTEFTAQKTTTQYCSHNCSSRAYKQRKRDARAGKINAEVLHKLSQPIEAIKVKEFITVRETATLLGYSRRTVYRLLQRGELQGLNPGTRTTRITRLSIDTHITQQTFDPPEPKEYGISECYTIGEAQIAHNVPGKTLYDIIKRNNIPKFQKGKYVYVPKELIDKLFT